jgi:hypothetical protein
MEESIIAACVSGSDIELSRVIQAGKFDLCRGRTSGSRARFHRKSRAFLEFWTKSLAVHEPGMIQSTWLRTKSKIS